jgi:hypothetical protein
MHSNGHSSQDVLQRNVSRKIYSVSMRRLFSISLMQRAYILKTPPRKLSGMASAVRQRSVIDERHLQSTLSHLKALEGFNHMLVKMEKGEGVSFVYDLTVELTVEENTEQCIELHSVDIDEDECAVALEEDDNSDNKEG